MGANKEQGISTDAAFAQIVVEDTIVSAHEKMGLEGDVAVRQGLMELRGEHGGNLVQAVLAEYGGSEKAGEASGVKPAFDLRVAQHIQSVTADGLKRELQSQLQAYLSLPPNERLERVRGYKLLRSQPTQISATPHRPQRLP